MRLHLSARSALLAAAGTAICLASYSLPAQAQALTFTNRTTANGLGSNPVQDVFANGSIIYVATNNGLSISINGGSSFNNYTTANGLGGNTVNGVYASGLHLCRDLQRSQHLYQRRHKLQQPHHCQRLGQRHCV